MPPKNYIRPQETLANHSTRAVVLSADAWLQAAGLPTYSELEARIAAMEQLRGTNESASGVPEFEDMPPVQYQHQPMARRVELTEGQKRILKRGLTGFCKKGRCKWISDSGEVRRDYLVLHKYGLIKRVQHSDLIAVAFATEDGRRWLEEDADRF